MTERKPQRHVSVVRAVKKDLGRLPLADRGCALAASALTLAALLDTAAEAYGEFDDKRLSSASQAARELRSTMTELLKGAPRARSAIDDLRARRAARASAGQAAAAAAVSSEG